MTKFFEKHTKIGFSGSNKNEVIRAVLNFLIFFYLRKDFARIKRTKSTKNKNNKKNKKYKNANKRISDFFPLRCFLCV